MRARRALALLRFLTPTALPTHRGLPLSGFACPSHVASLHLPCASTPYSLGELPGVLSTRCAHGMKSPSELDLTKIATVSRCGIPSCDWLPSRVQSDNKAYCSRLPETGRPPGSAPRPDQLRPVPLGSQAFSRFRRWRHCCTQRPRFRGLIPLPVETPLADDFSAWRRPGSLGLSLPGAFPFPSLGRND